MSALELSLTDIMDKIVVDDWGQCRSGRFGALRAHVDTGKLTEATVYQKAARLTLKLVSEHGGEALANTAWSVVTRTGDSVVDAVGAFPSVVLAEGEYTAIAKHEGQTFERDFKVEPGLNRDVEVLTADASGSADASPPAPVPVPVQQ